MFCVPIHMWMTHKASERLTQICALVYISMQDVGQVPAEEIGLYRCQSSPVMEITDTKCSFQLSSHTHTQGKMPVQPPDGHTHAQGKMPVQPPDGHA